MNVIVCSGCNNAIWYNNNDTVYLKCWHCDNVLVERKLSMIDLCRNCEDCK